MTLAVHGSLQMQQLVLLLIINFTLLHCQVAVLYIHPLEDAGYTQKNDLKK